MDQKRRALSSNLSGGACPSLASQANMMGLLIVPQTIDMERSTLDAPFSFVSASSNMAGLFFYCKNRGNLKNSTATSEVYNIFIGLLR